VLPPDGSATRAVLEQLGGICGRNRGSLASSPAQVEKRLADLGAVLEELGSILAQMEEIVAASKAHASTLPTEELLSRGRFGAQHSVMDRLHLMAQCLSLHQCEYELKEKMVKSLTFSMSPLTLTTYIIAWKTKPFAGEWRRTVFLDANLITD